jgi:hypothetical protein
MLYGESDSNLAPQHGEITNSNAAQAAGNTSQMGRDYSKSQPPGLDQNQGDGDKKV